MKNNSIKQSIIEKFVRLLTHANPNALELLGVIVKTYTKPNHRNNKKDEKSLYKHAMHLIRLLMTGTDILNESDIVTRHQEEQGLLLDIRGGKYSFDEIFALTDRYQEQFESAAKNTNLLDEPNLEAIDRFLMGIY